MRFLRLVPLLMGLCACDLFEKVAADKVLVVTWFDVPAVDTPPFNLIPDIGATTVTAIFADAKNRAAPTPVTHGFTAFFGIGKLEPLTETATPGTYMQSSRSADNLAYDPNPQHRYGFEACTKTSAAGCVGEEYTINSILAAPVISKASLSVSPALGPADLPGFDGSLPSGTAFTVTFPPAPAGEQYRPILEVFGNKADGSGPGLVYSSLPTSAQDLLSFLNSTPPTSLTIPADTLSATGAYVVAAASMRLSLQTSTNLFIGSGALAASANVFVVEVK